MSHSDREDSEKRFSFKGMFRANALLPSFFLIVVIPMTMAFLYLANFTENRFHSDTKFSVTSADNSQRNEGVFSGRETRPEVTAVTQYIHSQEMVEKMAERVDLSKAFSGKDNDFLFSIPEDPSDELMLRYWRRMVTVTVEPGSDVISLRVVAFSAEDAQEIAGLIVDESTHVIDEMNLGAEKAALTTAQKRVNNAKNQVKSIRQVVRKFRKQNNILTPKLSAPMDVVPALELDLARALVERATLGSNEKSSVVNSLDRRIAAIRWQIEANEAQALKTLEISDKYDDLMNELSSAQHALDAALMGKEEARAEANEMRRILQVHTAPTLTENSQYPNRPLLMFWIFCCLFASWAVAVLIYQNIEDRS